ncbi:MAG: hypothetical protein IJK84_03100 [Bacteroidales bacterium]|nr:hypothetical protein [Bacteroidales bacterium]
MKQLALTLLLFAALTVAAQEPTKLIQRLDLSSQKYLMIHVGGEYASVAIYQDTTDYVAVNNPQWNDSSQTSQPLFELTQNDFLHILWVGGNARAGVIEIHTKRSDLDISSRLYNHVGIFAAKAHDTIRLRTLRVRTDDYSMVEIAVPLVAEDVQLIAEKHSTIYYDSYAAERYSENTKENGIIYGGMRNGESLAKNHRLFDYNTEGYKLMEYRYRPAQRLHLSLTAALLSAGSKPLSGFGWTENHYVEDYPYPDIKTTLGCYQLTLSYDIVCRKHFAFGLGLEYSYNRFKYQDPYVDYYYNRYEPDEYGRPDNNYLVPMEPPYGGGDSLQYWSSQLTAKYVAIPIGVTYYSDKNHRKGWHVGLELVPSFNINEGKLYRRYSQWDEIEGTNTTEGFVVNSYLPIPLYTTVDLRLTIGWGAWSVMVQGSPDSANWGFRTPSSVYPFRMGVRVSL